LRGVLRRPAEEGCHKVLYEGKMLKTTNTHPFGEKARQRTSLKGRYSFHPPYWFEFVTRTSRFTRPPAGGRYNYTTDKIAKIVIYIKEIIILYK
jgi:hypothetical protein